MKIYFPFAVTGTVKVLRYQPMPPGNAPPPVPAGCLFTELAFDAPVVRQVQLPPLRIVQIDVLSISDIAKLKAPVLVERHSFSRPRISEAK